LHLAPEDEYRLWEVLETARRWVAGKATIEECLKGSLDAVYVASRIADAAYAVAGAAYAALGAAYAAYYAACCASNAASCAANAASCAANAVGAVADAITYSGGDREKALADLADIVRRRLYMGEIKL
jgi:hypothetical protein